MHLLAPLLRAFSSMPSSSPDFPTSATNARPQIVLFQPGDNDGCIQTGSMPTLLFASLIDSTSTVLLRNIMLILTCRRAEPTRTPQPFYVRLLIAASNICNFISALLTFSGGKRSTLSPMTFTEPRPNRRSTFPDMFSWYA